MVVAEKNFGVLTFLEVYIECGHIFLQF